MARLILISDTHGLARSMWYKVTDFIDPNQENVLLHSGDCTNVGKEVETLAFINWFKSLNGFHSKYFIAGNHDFSFEVPMEPWLRSTLEQHKLDEGNVIYLKDESHLLTLSEFSRPLKVYGSPWQPWFYDWAFNLPRNGPGLMSKWEDIPSDCDILITHSPPYGVLDFTPGGQSVGCEMLRDRLNEITPLLNVFGHIHFAHGHTYRSGCDTLYVNASICTEQYIPMNKPIVVDIIEEDGEFKLTVVE